MSGVVVMVLCLCCDDLCWNENDQCLVRVCVGGFLYEERGGSKVLFVCGHRLWDMLRREFFNVLFSEHTLIFGTAGDVISIVIESSFIILCLIRSLWLSSSEYDQWNDWYDHQAGDSSQPCHCRAMDFRNSHILVS